MEPNEKKDDIEPEELEEPEEILDENTGEDITDWKADALKRHGIAKRHQTKHKKEKEAHSKTKEEFEAYKKANPEKAKEPEKPQDKKEFDMAEKSYLLAKGIEESQFQLVWDEKKASGKSIEELLGSKYFQEKLEVLASKEAIPKGNKRGGGSTKDEVDYWVAKGEYPPKDQVELRRKVAKALAKEAVNKDKFSPDPIV